MPRFEQVEVYNNNGLMKVTYQVNKIESIKLRIGMIIEKTYDLATGEYLGCRHLEYEAAVQKIDWMLEDGSYIKEEE